MRKIILALAILVLSVPSLSIAETSRGMAEVSRSGEKTSLQARRMYRNSITIYFPWGRCRTYYTAPVPYPEIIRGYACGTYVVCRRRSGRNYLCRY